MRLSISSCVGNLSPGNILCTGSKSRDTERDKYAFLNGNKTLWLKRYNALYNNNTNNALYIMYI